MDHKVDVIGELQPGDLQQIPGMVGSNGEHLGWVGIRFQVDDGDGMREGMKDDLISDSVLTGAAVDLDINTYRNTKR